LLSHLEEFKKLGFPVLVGWSRKSMIGEALENAKPAERLYGSLAAETILALKQPAIIRTHDVAAVYDALRVVNWYQEHCEVA